MKTEKEYTKSVIKSVEDQIEKLRLDPTGCLCSFGISYNDPDCPIEPLSEVELSEAALRTSGAIECYENLLNSLKTKLESL